MSMAVRFIFRPAESTARRTNLNAPTKTNEAKETAPKQDKDPWSPLWICVGLVLVVIAVAYMALWSSFPKPISYVEPVVASHAGDSEASTEERARLIAMNEYLIARSAQLGQTGDFVGGLLNPVLTFISVIALILTIWITMRSAVEEQRLNRLSARISALTALYQAAGTDYEIYRNAAGPGAAPAAEKARRRQHEIADLLRDYYADLHQLDVPHIPLPTSLQDGKGRSDWVEMMTRFFRKKT